MHFVACILNLEHFVDHVYVCPLSGTLFIFPTVFGWHKATSVTRQSFFPSVVFSCLPFCLNDLQTSLSLCESVGLGCYWVDYSELWKWKRTSLTFTNSGNSSLCFPLQCCPSVFIKRNPLFPFSWPNLHIWYYIYVLCLFQMLCIYSFIHRTVVPQWQPPPKATPHKTSGDSLHLGTPEQVVPQLPGRSCWGFTPHRLLLPLEYMHWELKADKETLLKPMSAHVW